MRRFLLIAHDIPLDGTISLDDLPGAGRLDLIARCVTSGLLLSHDIRSDVHVSVVVRDELTIRFDGTTLQGLNPDERSTAALLRRALDARSSIVGHEPVETTPGVTVRGYGLAETIDAMPGTATVVPLHETGVPIVEVDPLPEPVFVLSDHRPFTETERQLLDAHAASWICLGPRRLHADQAITIAHNYLDTAGYDRYSPAGEAGP